MISDSDFLTAADATLDAIGRALDDALAQSDADVDWTLNDGILTIEPEGGGRIIVNRHVPNREIWVAAKSGGLHFRPDDGKWRDARGRDELAATLVRLLKLQARLNVRMPELPAPLEP